MQKLILTKENVVDYLMSRTSLFERGAGLSVRLSGEGEGPQSVEGDGYVNFVFRVASPDRSVIVKQALDYIRVLGEDFTLTPARNLSEASIMRIRHAVCPQYVPELYHVDIDNDIFIMEDLSAYKLMRFELNNMRVFENFPRQIGEYFAACNFFTSMEYLDERTFKELEIAFYNIELREVMENFIFLPRDQKHTPAPTAQHSEYMFTPFFWNRGKLVSETTRCRNKFMRTRECLIHGDLHTSNIFIGDDMMKVIDMEYAFMGPEAHDMGYLIANCISEYSAFHYRREFSELEAGRYRVYLLTKLHDIFACYSKSYSALFSQYAKPLYSEVPGYLDEKLACFAYDMIGYAACANLSRTIGMMGYPDFDVIEDADDRLRAKMLSALISATVLENHAQIRTTDQLITHMQAIAKAYTGGQR